MKRSQVIALSAMAAALCSLFLTLGAYVSVLDVSCYMFASVMLMIPLFVNQFLGAFLAYLAAGLMALLFSGGNFFAILPYVFFFGLHPIVNAFQVKKNINKYLAFAVKAVWFDVSVYVMYRFLSVFTVEIQFIADNIIWIIAVGGTLIFVLYDFVMMRMQGVVNYYIKRFKK